MAVAGSEDGRLSDVQAVTHVISRVTVWSGPDRLAARRVVVGVDRDRHGPSSAGVGARRLTVRSGSVRSVPLSTSSVRRRRTSRWVRAVDSLNEPASPGVPSPNCLRSRCRSGSGLRVVVRVEPVALQRDTSSFSKSPRPPSTAPALRTDGASLSALTVIVTVASTDPPRSVEHPRPGTVRRSVFASKSVLIT